MWRYGAGDWTEPFRVFHGLGPDWRPLTDDGQDAAPRRIRYIGRYRNLLYGFAKAAAVMEEGFKDRPGPRPARRKPDPGKPREHVTTGGLILPTGRPDPAP